MRTQHVRRRVPLAKKALFSVIGTVSGNKLPDVAYVMMHRPELFGTAFSDWLQRLMRGASEWSVGERELFASYTSFQQQCEF